MPSCGSALLAGQLNTSPASPPRDAVAEPRGGRCGRDRQREQRQPTQTRRQPSAPADLGQQASSDEALQAPKAPPHHPPPNPQPPPSEAQGKKRPPRKEGLARHCPDQRPLAKIKELAASSDPT